MNILQKREVLMKWVGNVITVMIFLYSVAAADSLNVPGDFETIQDAIDAAGDGDDRRHRHLPTRPLRDTRPASRLLHR